MSGVDQNEDTMRSKDHAPGSSEVKASAASKDKRSFKESAVLRISALALALSAVFPGAASANDSQSVVQPRAERVGAPNLQTDKETHSAISPDAVETTPVPKPTATPVVTEAPQAVAQLKLPTATPTETAVPVFAETKTITITTATVNSSANLRIGPGTTYEVADTTTLGSTYKVVDTSKDGKWHQLEGEGGINLWIHTSLVDLIVETTTSAGPNTGGALPSETGTDLPSSTTKEPSQETEITEVTIEQLAEMIADPILGGNDPVEPAEGVTIEKVNTVLNQALMALFQTQSKLSLAEIKAIIDSGEPTSFYIPTEDPKGPTNRSPVVLSPNPLEIQVDLSKSIEISYFSTEEKAREHLVSLGITFDYSEGLLLRKKGKVVGSFFTTSSYKTYRYILSNDGRLTMIFGDTDGSAREDTAYFQLFLMAFVHEIFDVLGSDGKPTYNYIEMVSIVSFAPPESQDSMVINGRKLTIPPQLRPDNFFWLEGSYLLR